MNKKKEETKEPVSYIGSEQDFKDRLFEAIEYLKGIVNNPTLKASEATMVLQTMRNTITVKVVEVHRF